MTKIFPFKKFINKRALSTKLTRTLFITTHNTYRAMNEITVWLIFYILTTVLDDLFSQHLLQEK